jgi:hypothetical protein
MHPRAGILAGGCGLVLAALLLSSCTPAITGAVGVGVDVEGRPVGYIQTCRGSLDRAYIYEEPTTRNSSTVARWEAEPGVTGASSWSFAHPSGIWSATKPMPELREGAAYSLRASAADDSGTTEYVSFTLADLRAMRPGQVRVPDIERAIASAPAEDLTGDPKQLALEDNAFSKIIGEAEFRRTACLY